MNTYPVNELVRLSVAFTDPLNNNEPVDPTTVSLTLTQPGAVVQSPIIDGIARDSTGAYHYDLLVTLMGLWVYRWQGEGAVIASSGNGFFQAI